MLWGGRAALALRRSWEGRLAPKALERDEEGLQGRGDRLVAPPHDGRMPPEGGLERHSDQPPPADPEPPRARRGDADAKPGLDETLDRLGVAELHGDPRVHATPAEPRLDHATDCPAALVADQWIAGQLR